MSKGASTVCSAFLTLGQSDEPVTTCSIKSPGSSLQRDMRYLEISSRVLFWSSVDIRGTILRKHLTIFDIPNGDWLFCPKTYDHFASCASQVSLPITHNQGVHDLDIFISDGIFGAARPSTILNMRGSRNFRQGGPVQSNKKALTTFF